MYSICKNTPGCKFESQMFIFNKSLNPNLHIEMLNITNNEMFYNEEVTIPINEMQKYMTKIQHKVKSGNDILTGLLNLLTEVFKDKIDLYNNMILDNKITFSNLNNLFQEGSRFVAHTMEHQLVGSIVSETFDYVNSFNEKFFVVSGMFIMTNGKQFYQQSKSFEIVEFRGLKNISDLNVRPMTDDDYRLLTSRGEKFVKYGIGAHYVYYTGTMYYQNMFTNVHFNGTGRIMIDPISYKIMTNQSRDNFNNKSDLLALTIPENLLFCTWPFTQGFSFVSKKWGNIFIDNVSEIIFNEDAFDKLVLDDDKKEIAKALVMNNENSFSDIVSEKNGGVVFLLSGSPGIGKTLTAEAIADVLHRPLYRVTGGELGIDSQAIESKLNEILEIANSWKSFVLLDECDVFLSKRTNNDVLKNSLVSIFLNLLESHQGVLFLTTNRLDSIDEAFHSRISMIFNYPDLDKTMRIKIWQMLLNSAKVEMSNYNIIRLARHEINGRQIKMAIKSALALANSKKVKLDVNHIELIIKINCQL